MGTLKYFQRLGEAECGASSSYGNMWQGAGTQASPYALDFNTPYGYVTLPTNDTDWSNGITFEVWANTQAGQAMPRFMEMATQPQFGANIIFWRTGRGFNGHNPNQLILSIYNQQGQETRAFSPDDLVVDGEWHQYVALARKDSSTQAVSYHFYRDGAEFAVSSQEYTPVTPVNAARADVYIGHSNFPADEPFLGAMSIVRVYDRGFTDEEVATHCGMVAPRFGVVCP